MKVPSFFRKPIFIVCSIFFVLLSISAWLLYGPKSEPLSAAPDMLTGYYWGDDRFLGRHWYRVEINEGFAGHGVTEIKGPGWNQYRSYYPDGTLHEEAEIMVEYLGYHPYPLPDRENVRWGNYYRPDGALSSQVRDGTGTTTLWFPNGQLRGRVVLKDYKRVLFEMWHHDGKLIGREEYENGVLIQDYEDETQPNE